MIGILCSCSEYDQELRISVIPRPSSVTAEGGFFRFNGRTTVTYPSECQEIENAVAALNEKFSVSAGFTVKNGSSESNCLCFVPDTTLKAESYRLEVAPERVMVSFGDPAGAYYAVQTLLQLLPVKVFSPDRIHFTSWKVPCCKIEDSPRFRYRGMHLDCCLHFFDIEFLKKYIDVMAMHKINVFHWHLTEDQGWRLEIKKYPLLTEKGQWRKETVVGSLSSGVYDGIPHGGYYSQEQVRDLVEYAERRYVTIIPEIEMPGHALAAISCYPELSCGLEDHYETATRWGVFRQVYCPKPETFKFLEDVMDEVFDLFPSKTVHIGGDECPKTSWKQCPHCQALIKELGLKDEFELQSWFITRMEKYINSKGHEIIGWDEILQGGLAPNAKVMSWLGEEGGIKAAQQHHEVVMAPYPKYYLDYWQADPESEPLAMGGPTTLRTMYEYDPVPSVLTKEEAEYIIGVEGCVWTEYLPSPQRVEYMAWPRMCAIAESGWSSSSKDWDCFANRLDRHFGILDYCGVNSCKAFYSPYIVLHDDTEYDKVVTMSVDAPDAEIHYTLDGSEPTIESDIYKQAFVINKSQIVKALAFRNGKATGEIKSKHF